jgi:hypothetical protein
MSALDMLEQNNNLKLNNKIFKPLLKPRPNKSMTTTINKNRLIDNKRNSYCSTSNNSLNNKNDDSLNYEEFEKDLNEELLNEKDNKSIFDEISLIFKENKYTIINNNILRRSVPLNNNDNIPIRCSNPFFKNF